MNDHPGWQMRFTMSRDPAAPEMFGYRFEVEPIGAGDAAWIPFIDGSFVATGGGARRGMGHLPHAGRRAAERRVPDRTDGDGNVFKDLDGHVLDGGLSDQRVDDARALPEGRPHEHRSRSHYHYEAQANGQAAMEFSGTDCDERRFDQRHQPLARDRRGAGPTRPRRTARSSGTRTECWDDSFVETYNNKPWDATPGVNHGDPGHCCPDISTL